MIIGSSSKFGKHVVIQSFFKRHLNLAKILNECSNASMTLDFFDNLTKWLHGHFTEVESKLSKKLFSITDREDFELVLSVIIDKIEKNEQLNNITTNPSSHDLKCLEQCHIMYGYIIKFISNTLNNNESFHKNGGQNTRSKLKEMLNRMESKLFCDRIRYLGIKLESNLFSLDRFDVRAQVSFELRELLNRIEYLQTKNANDNLYKSYLKEGQIELYVCIFMYIKSYNSSFFKVDIDKIKSTLLNSTKDASEYTYSRLFVWIANHLVENGEYFEAWTFLQKAFKLGVVARYSDDKNYKPNLYSLADKLTKAIGVSILRNMHNWSNQSFIQLKTQWLVLSSIHSMFGEWMAPKKDVEVLGEHVKVKQSEHWQKLLDLKKDLLIECPNNVKLHNKRPISFEVLCAELEDSNFIKRLEKDLKKKKNSIDIEVNHGKLKTSDLYLVELEHVISFVNLFKEKLLKHRAKKNQPFDASDEKRPLTTTENGANSGYVMNDNNAPISGHAYRTANHISKIFSLEQSELSTSDSDSESDLEASSQSLFGDNYKDLDIKPCKMLGMISTPYYICLRGDGKEDECSKEIRDKFKPIFATPKQCREKNQQGFKLRRLNGEIMLEAKILSKEGGNFRAYPAQKVQGKDGAVLLIYDKIIKKNKSQEKHHAVNKVNKNNNNNAPKPKAKNESRKKHNKSKKKK